MRSGQHGAFFVPYDLLAVEESDAQQAVQDLAREFARMRYVSHFETRNQCECIGPIGARVPGNSCLRVSMCASSDSLALLLRGRSEQHDRATRCRVRCLTGAVIINRGLREPSSRVTLSTSVALPHRTL